MALEIISGKLSNGAQKVVVYGPEGIGKSTFAAAFPGGLFIDTEGSTKELDVRRLQPPSSWAMLTWQVEQVKNEPEICRSLIIDTADWAEKLCIHDICSKRNVSGIEDFGYGKGYVYLEEEFGRFLNKLTELVELGINVVVTAHAIMRKFEQPDESGAYDRWELKLQKKTAPLLKEWADMLLFANYETYVVKEGGGNDGMKKAKAKGGKRVMYTTHHPCWDAKNRKGLPEKMDFNFAGIAHAIPGRNPGQHVTQIADHTKQEELQQSAMAKEEPEGQSALGNIGKVPARQRLYDLMDVSDVTRKQLEAFVVEKGVLLAAMPIEEFPEDLMEYLVSRWNDVHAAILEDEIPF